jgi:phosphocarrier protein HPr
MVERTLVIKGRLGLHARAAAKLVRVASGFKSELLLSRTDAGTVANAKSILSLLMLAASRGTELRASANGVDEEAAMNAIEEFFLDGFGEIETESSI